MNPDKRKFGIRIRPLNIPRRFIPDEKGARTLEEELKLNEEDLLQIKTDEIAHELLEATSTSLFSGQIAITCQKKPFKDGCLRLAELTLDTNPNTPFQLSSLVTSLVRDRMFEQGEALTPKLVDECQTKIMVDISRRH